MTEFEQELSRALQRFIADAMRAAQRAVLQDVQSAFACLVPPGRSMADSAATASDARRRLARSLRHRTPTPIEPAAVVARAETVIRDHPGLTTAQLDRALCKRPAVLTRALAAIREHPGRTTAELGRALGINSDRLRPYLRELANEGAIRIEQTQFGRLRRYACFAAEQLNGHAVAPAMPAEATA